MNEMKTDYYMKVSPMNNPQLTDEKNKNKTKKKKTSDTQRK